MTRSEFHLFLFGLAVGAAIGTAGVMFAVWAFTPSWVLP